MNAPCIIYKAKKNILFYFHDPIKLCWLSTKDMPTTNQFSKPEQLMQYITKHNFVVPYFIDNRIIFNVDKRYIYAYQNKKYEKQTNIKNSQKEK